jgi:hypothetical protein
MGMRWITIGTAAHRGNAARREGHLPRARLDGCGLWGWRCRAVAGVVPVSVHMIPVWELVHAETDRLLAEADSLESILLAAATMRDDGEDLSGVVVLKASQYEPAATALVQEGLV